MTIIKVSKIQLAAIDNALRQGLKIDAIKAIRETNRQPPSPGHSVGTAMIGLKEAKDLVDGAPKAVLEKVSKDDAAKAKAKLEESGAGVEVK